MKKKKKTVIAKSFKNDKLSTYISVRSIAKFSFYHFLLSPLLGEKGSTLQVLKVNRNPISCK